jgi:hypothetical protein
MQQSHQLRYAWNGIRRWVCQTTVLPRFSVLLIVSASRWHDKLERILPNLVRVIAFNLTVSQAKWQQNNARLFISTVWVEISMSCVSEILF